MEIVSNNQGKAYPHYRSDCGFEDSSLCDRYEKDRYVLENSEHGHRQILNTKGNGK